MQYRLKFMLLLFLLGFCTYTLQAQEVYTSSGRSVQQSKKIRKEKEKGFDASRIIFGGGVGLSFGTVTSVAVAPVVGYRITDNFSAGISMGYQYLNVRDFFKFDLQYYPYRASIYSGGIWARYLVWKNLFVHTEYEHNFMSFREYRKQWDGTRNAVVSENVMYNAPSLLLGVGLRQPLNDRVSIILLGLYDVIQDTYSPYRGRIDLRVGVNVGF